MRFLQFLRSRRLAIILLVGLTVYSWLATIVSPVSGLSRLTSIPFVTSIAETIGFDQPFSAPLFLLAVGLVTLTTGICAWERTRIAARGFSRPSVTEAARDRLAGSPQFVVPVDEVGFDRRTATAAAIAVLRRLHLRVDMQDEVVTGTTRAWGPAGSALFHWALVALFIFVALGQLTRYEGYINVLPGGSFSDSEGSYSEGFSGGALAGQRYTGLILSVTEVDLNFVAGGTARGPSPRVMLSDGSRELKTQWVYPNGPLRHGPLLVHSADTVPVFLGTVTTDTTSEDRKVTLYYDFDSREPQGFTLDDAAGGSGITVTVAPTGGGVVEVGVRNGSAELTHTAGIGESVELKQGLNLRVDELTYAAQLHVVNDWTVPWLYAMFILGILGVSAAVFLPTRSVALMVVESPGGEADGAALAGLVLNVRCSHRRSDPAFPYLLEVALTDAVSLAASAEPSLSREEPA